MRQCLALFDQDLGLHDVDAGHLFGDGVFDLNARVHLDEVEFLIVHIHQEFDSARAFILHMGADFPGHFADIGALGLGQIGGGGAFDDLLVAPLHGAVALPQVPDIARLVAQDLHLDMAGAQDHLFQIALAIAKGGLGLAPALAHLQFQLVLRQDRAHAPTAAAPGGLEHQGIAYRLGLLFDGSHILAQHLGCRNDGHARLDRDASRAGLVAQGAHGFRTRADEGDAGLIAGFDEIGVFRQKPIAGVDRIGPGHFGHADDFRDRQISPHRRQALTDQIGLVRLEAVQRKLVLFGIDRNGFLAHFIGRAHDANGNLATVGDKDLLEFGHGLTSGRGDAFGGQLRDAAAQHKGGKRRPANFCEIFRPTLQLQSSA